MVGWGRRVDRDRFAGPEQQSEGEPGNPPPRARGGAADAYDRGKIRPGPRIGGRAGASAFAARKTLTLSVIAVGRKAEGLVPTAAQRLVRTHRKRRLIMVGVLYARRSLTAGFLPRTYQSVNKFSARETMRN